MGKGHDFLDESSARGHAVINLACFFVVLGILAAVTWLIPVEWERAWLWVCAGLATAGAVLIGWAVAHGPALVRGGTYRVEVRDGRLRVDSPSPALGPSFDVPVGEIGRLVVRSDADGPAGYEVRTQSGEAFEVNGFRAERLFEALRRLRPDLASR